MPQINMALRQFCRRHLESVEITLESIGESPQKTRPTVLVVCTSVGKVRNILKKKLEAFFDDTTGFALKVCRGSVVRSRKGETTRSMASGKNDTEGNEEQTAANPGFQVRPQNGASIGAWIGDRHLPPVSFGGLIAVDNKMYGMTVHHMLDDQEEMSAHAQDPTMITPSMRSSAAAQDLTYLDAELTDDSSGSEDYACEFSDTETNYSATDLSSDDEEEDNEYEEEGDIPGVEAGCGSGYIITQPAFDDVDKDFYPSEETENEDHLDTYRLGEVYATSGIRRRHESNGYIHEIDWALFEFEDERFPETNHLPRLKLPGQSLELPTMHFQPTAVAASDELPGMDVQCSARTSGLQTGKILTAMASIKVYGRTSMSHTYQVSGKAGSKAIPGLGFQSSSSSSERAIPGASLGIPGDSGAWVIDRRQGHLCGHVLAFSHRKQVAYISPMDVLIKDIAETLDASEVRLGGVCIFERNPSDARIRTQPEVENMDDLVEGEDEDDNDEVQRQLARSMRALTTDMDRMHFRAGLVQ